MISSYDAYDSLSHPTNHMGCALLFLHIFFDQGDSGNVVVSSL